jgi:hypothetical protein
MNRPVRDDLMLRDVDDHDAVAGFVVDVDASGRRIRHARFRLPSQWNRRDDFAAGVDHRRGLAVAVEGVDLLLLRLVHDEVWVGLRLDLADRLQRLGVHDARRVAAAVAREHMTVRGNDGSVHARRVGNLADDFVLRHIEDDDFGRVTDVQTLRDGVNVQIVPSTLAAELHVLDELIRSVGSPGLNRQQPDGERRRDETHTNHLQAHTTSGQSTSPASGFARRHP